MRTCNYYFLIEPVRSEFHDSAESTPIWSVPITFEELKLTLSLFTDEQSLPAYARLSIPGLADDKIPQELVPVINAVRQHLIAALRFGYHGRANLFSHSLWNFTDDNAPPEMAIGVTFGGSHTFDPEKTRVVFAAAFNFRQEVRLLVDAADDHIPIQYRYLSAYKLVELEFRVDGEWRTAELDEFLKPYEEQARGAGIVRLLRNEFHALRDKCAHIKTGGEFGVTQLNVEESSAVDRVLPIIWDVALAVLNRRAKGTLQMGRMPQQETEPSGAA